MDLDPFSDEAIKLANPAFGDFQSAEEVRAMAEDARRMPSRESEYRNLVLNQRVERNNPFVAPAIWKQNGAPPLDDFDGLDVYAGLDLSETNDLTALVLLAKHDGAWHVKPTFWLPEDGLRDKAQKDRVPYDVWADSGLLQTTPGKSIEYEFVAEHLRMVFDRLNVKKLAFDRWNMRHLKPWLVRVGFGEWDLETKFSDFGQGFISMSPALRTLEGQLLNGNLRHGMHPVLTMCAANAVVQADPAGNRKLSKSKSRGRIDGMVALAMAMSIAAEDSDQSSVYETRGLIVI